jgi:hypothetical protein
MTRNQLAQQLRRNQYAEDRAPRTLRAVLNDRETVHYYITSPGCGKKKIEGKLLDGRRHDSW